VKKVLIFGGSGGLAGKLISSFLDIGYIVDIVTRSNKNNCTYDNRVNVFYVKLDYLEFVTKINYDIIFFCQCLFDPCELINTTDEAILNQFRVGLIDPIIITKKLLQLNAIASDIISKKQDFCYIGSTSAYAGFKKTSIYCSLKHAILGFVRSMNDEYSETNTRFWLFSMGSMNTKMGMKVTGQDKTTFLDPCDVANRIVNTLKSDSNMFEPEVIIRRRKVKFL